MLTFDRMFQSGMVLQRQKPVAVWGKADPGAKILISIQGKSAEAVAGRRRSLDDDAAVSGGVGAGDASGKERRHGACPYRCGGRGGVDCRRPVQHGVPDLL